MPDNSRDQSIDQRRDVLREAVKAAGDVALHFFENGVKSWEKAESDPVSEADLAIDKLLRERLLDATPDHGWLSEETARQDHHLEPDAIWVVDPIDGTRAFIQGKPHFTISVALMIRGNAYLAAVFNPATDELFEATLGQGATLNGQPTQVGNHGELKDCRMIGYRDMFAAKHWRTPWPTLDIHMVNSIAYRMALVACGKFDACINLKPQHDWDIAAAELILREAGGRSTNRQGEQYEFAHGERTNQNVIAANPALHQKLLSKLDEFDPVVPKDVRQRMEAEAAAANAKAEQLKKAQKKPPGQ